jgi:hypothetical protein
MDWTQNIEFIQWGGRGWGSAAGQPGFDAPFEGTISDRQIYDVALSAEQIGTLHADGPPNADPVALDDTLAVTEDMSATLDPAANDSDPDGDAVGVTAIATDPANGAAVLNPDGTVTYTPDPDFNGTDSFEVTVGDGKGGSDTSVVNVTVAAVEDDPVANDDSAQVQQGNPVVIDVLANDSDADGDPLSVLSVGAAANGSVVDNGDGTVTYTPGAPDFTGVDTFDYVLSDGAGPTDTGTVTVEVTAEPVQPVPVYEQPGVTSYNGSSAAVQNIAPSDVFEFREGTVAFSLVDDNPGVRQGLITKDASFFVDGGHFAAYVDKGDLKVRFQDTDSSATLTFDDLVAGQEYEVAAVFGDAGVELWVDGVLAGAETGFQSSWETNQEFLQIGGLGWGSATGADTFTNPFSGQIADLEIYDTALDADTIIALSTSSSFDII